MKKIFAWIKRNILGLEEPVKRKRQSVRKKRSVSDRALPKVASKNKVHVSLKTQKNNRTSKEAKLQKPAKNPIFPKVSASTQKKLKQNSDQLLQVSKQYLKSSASKRPSQPVESAEAISAPKPEGKKVGVITHFFPNVSAAIIKTSSVISVGDPLRFVGPATDFKITVRSMQMNRAPIEKALKGQEIGIQVPDKVRPGDEVYKTAKLQTARRSARPSTAERSL